MRRSIFFFFCLIVAVFSYLLFILDFYGLVYRPMPVPENHPIVFHFDKNATARSFVRFLKLEHLIHSPRFFLLMIRLQGMSNQLKAGIYEIKPGETAQDFLKRVVRGDVLSLSFPIIEGSTIQNVQKQAEKAQFLLPDPNALANLAGPHPSAEGQLLADTYRYVAGSNVHQLFTNAHAKLLEVLEKAWDTRDADLPYQTAYEMLIAASILEKEAAIPAEKKLISGVIVNRLHAHMPLQMDPTVIYAMGENYQGVLKHRDLSVDSPYNTYLHPGLPPTPIAMVGKDAIAAAAHPTRSHYLYFVARGDGSHQFSETYAQQQKAISTYSHHSSDKK